MRAFKVRLFEIPSLVLAPTAPMPSPKEVPGFAVDAEDIDRARTVCRLRLEERGRAVRTVSCLAGGEAELAAVVYEKALTAPLSPA